MVMLVSMSCATLDFADELYFGTGKPDGTTVSQADWRQFVNEVIAPRFTGFTEMEATGQYKKTSEPSHVVVIVHGRNAEDENKISEIITQYKQRFSQESVMRVRARVETSF